MIDQRKILIVEDNQDLAFGLQTNLEVQGYAVVQAGDGVSGLELATTETPDLIILDLMLPRKGGIDVLKSIRESGSRVPVLILTAKGNEVDKVLGLRLGADDYVTKPFGLIWVDGTDGPRGSLVTPDTTTRRAVGGNTQIWQHRNQHRVATGVKRKTCSYPDTKRIRFVARVAAKKWSGCHTPGINE